MSLDSLTLPKREINLDAPLEPVKKTRSSVLFAETGLRLEEVSLTGEERDLLLTHYAGSKSIIGRRLFYRIWYNGQHAGIVGVQSTATCLLKVARVLYRVDKVDRPVALRYLNEVVNNNVFRLLVNEANLASQVLKTFRKVVRADWEVKYHVRLRAIVSMTFGSGPKGGRVGRCYRADNWAYLGLTEGKKKILVHWDKTGKGKNVNKYVPTRQKHLFVFDYDRRPRTIASRRSGLVFGHERPSLKTGTTREIPASDPR